jgi:hypothetical protein
MHHQRNDQENRDQQRQQYQSAHQVKQSLGTRLGPETQFRFEKDK